MKTPVDARLATGPSPQRHPPPTVTWPWRGLAGLALLGADGALGPDLTPSMYWPDLGHYVPRYVLLALGIGFGLSAIRAGRGLDKLLGVAVFVVGGGLAAYFACSCLQLVGGRQRPVRRCRHPPACP